MALLVCGFYYIMLVSNGLSTVTSLTAASSASCQTYHPPPPLHTSGYPASATRQLLHCSTPSHSLLAVCWAASCQQVALSRPCGAASFLLRCQRPLPKLIIKPLGVRVIYIHILRIRSVCRVRFCSASAHTAIGSCTCNIL